MAGIIVVPTLEKPDPDLANRYFRSLPHLANSGPVLRRYGAKLDSCVRFSRPDGQHLQQQLHRAVEVSPLNHSGVAMQVSRRHVMLTAALPLSVPLDLGAVPP